MLEGNSRPVSFTCDNSLFTDSVSKGYIISYSDIGNLRGNFSTGVDLRRGEVSKAIIHRPTVFTIYDPFLVFPGEQVLVKKEWNNDFSFQEKNKKRNRELNLFKQINNVRPAIYLNDTENLTIDSILLSEAMYKREFLKLSSDFQFTMDSLLNNSRVSHRYKLYTRRYFQTDFNLYLYFLYLKHADTLKVYGQLQQKYIDLINSFSIKMHMSYPNINMTLFNQIAEKALPIIIWKVSSEREFDINFHFIFKNINGHNRDYLLSQLLYYALKKDIYISVKSWTQYCSLCRDSDLKKIIKKIYHQKTRLYQLQEKEKNNLLLSMDGKNISSIEQLIQGNRGKVILLDFWASWCSPCIEEMPYLKRISKNLDSVVFVGISMDSEIQPWRKKVISEQLNTGNQFLLIKPRDSEFVIKNMINAIPRFLIIDRDGRIIHSNAPSPSDPELSKILSGLIEK
jgi:thiol-disulfide isomerase/thioredoxin